MSNETIKLFCDECVFLKTTELLRGCGYDVITIQDLNLCGISDDQVIQYAKKMEAVLITNDQGFANIYKYPPYLFDGIIVLKMEEQINLIQEVHDILITLLKRENDFKKKLFVVDNHKYRIRKE